MHNGVKLQSFLLMGIIHIILLHTVQDIKRF